MALAGLAAVLIGAVTVMTAPAVADRARPMTPAPAGRPLPPEPRTWTLTALGDSVTAGTACDCQTFTDRYAELTAEATGHRVDPHNLGVAGLTSDGLVRMLRAGTGTSATVAASDIVLVTIGANDLESRLDQLTSGRCDVGCFASMTPGIRANITAAVARIEHLRVGRPTEILVTDYWNVFRDGDPAASLGAAYLSVSDAVTRLANTAICAGATAAGATCVDLYAPFKGVDGSVDPTRLLADDGDHPDAAGHQLIAEALADHGWRELG